MLEKYLQLAHNRFGLARNQPLHIPTEGMKQFRLTDDVRECYDNENEQGHERQQGVVSNRTRQKESLVGAEALQRLKRESPHVLQCLRRLRSEDIHCATQSGGFLQEPGAECTRRNSSTRDSCVQDVSPPRSEPIPVSPSYTNTPCSPYW